MPAVTPGMPQQCSLSKSKARLPVYSDGTVRQLWELSGDGGLTWQVLFDGLYRHPDEGASKEHQ